MIYNNLLYFLIAIFTFSMASEYEEPALSWYFALSGILVTIYVFDRVLATFFNKLSSQQAGGYFQAEKKGSIAALLAFSILTFGFDIKYYLAELLFKGTPSGLINVCGLVLFFLLFSMMWRRAKKSYQVVFQRNYTTFRFILSNLKANLPIVMPWVFLTLCYDFIELAELPGVNEFLNSIWGDVAFFGLFLIFVFVIFPPMVKKLWGCKKLEEGPLRDHLVHFSKKQNFNAEIYIWPLFEGRVITAGVMGVIPGLRYILLTQALLETMTIEEVDSVMTHEIGHVKRFHLLLYVFLMGGFIFSGVLISKPLFYTVMSKDIFYSLVSATGYSPETLQNIIVAVPALLSLLFFFRYIFGYFMRNFERQADLQVFPVLGNSTAIISAFEKIAVLSGNIRDEPSWHHFGIGERVDFLKRCENNPAEIGRHHKKVYVSLLLYVSLLFGAYLISAQINYGQAKDVYFDRFTRVELLYKAEQEKEPAHFLFMVGTYLIEHKQEQRAAIAFELAVERAPYQPELLNNYAWLLLTSKSIDLRDPLKALNMARKAAELKPVGYILDTLASAWWANGFDENAHRVMQQALFVDPEQRDYYQSQLKRFEQSSYNIHFDGNEYGNLPVGPKQEVEERG